MRAAIVLRYYEDMSEPDIAGCARCECGNGKKHLSQAVAKLRIDAELLVDFAGCAGPAAGIAVLAE